MIRNPIGDLMKTVFAYFRTMLALLAIFVIPSGLFASDHRDGPLPGQTPGADITDTWAFLSTTNPGRIVVAMGVNPLTVPSFNGTYDFSSQILYQIKIDSDGDGREDYVVQALFTGHGPTQTVTICGPFKPATTGARNKFQCAADKDNDRADRDSNARAHLVTGAISTNLGDANGLQGFAGLRDDPFVFDFSQFTKINAGTQDLFRQSTLPIFGALRGRSTPAGIDNLGGFNVSVIVAEFPSSWVRGRTSTVGVWSTTSRPETVTAGRESEKNPASDPAPDRLSSTFVQLDRAGQQAIGTVFIPKPLRDVYNADIPENDMVEWGNLVPDALTVTDNDGTGNTIAGRRAVLHALTLDDGTNGAPLLLPAGFANHDVNLLRKAIFPDMVRLNLDLAPGFAPIGGNGLQNGRGVDEDSIDIALRLLRELADVNFSAPVPAGIPGTGRARPGALNFPADRRVFAVLQGTDFIGPDASTSDLSNGGNDVPSTTAFPYFPRPNPPK
jgi:hypothetical protein